MIGIGLGWSVECWCSGFIFYNTAVITIQSQGDSGLLYFDPRVALYVRQGRAIERRVV